MDRIPSNEKTAAYKGEEEVDCFPGLFVFKWLIKIPFSLLKKELNLQSFN
jgi:hypothetical protein